MSPLGVAAKEFLQTLDKAQVPYRLVPFEGTARDSDQVLPSQLIDLYSIMCPQELDLPTVGNPVRFFGANELASAQEGYLPDPKTGWREGWLVILDEGGYPVFLNTADSSDTTVYRAQRMRRNKALVWGVSRLASDLTGFLRGLTIYVNSFSKTLGTSQDRVASLDDFCTLFRKRMQEKGMAEFTEEWLTWLGYK